MRWMVVVKLFCVRSRMSSVDVFLQIEFRYHSKVYLPKWSRVLTIPLSQSCRASCKSILFKHRPAASIRPLLSDVRSACFSVHLAH